MKTSTVKLPARTRDNVVVPLRKRMHSEQNLPIVDIGPLCSQDPKAQRHCANQIGEIAMENGFLYLVNHGIEQDLIDAVYEQAERFFSQSVSQKNRSYIGHSKNHRGYVPLTEKGDYADEQGARRYEAFDMGVERSGALASLHAKLPLVGPSVWPALPGFRYILNQYIQALTRIAETLCRGFALFLGVPEDYFSRTMQQPMSQLRLLHYLENKDQGPQSGVNMGAHTDYECFTILHSRTNSLQILNLEGEWICAPPVENAFYFNIGDMLEAWSGGLFVSTLHRVVNSGEERFSLPYFAATDFDTVVSPLHCPRFAHLQKDYVPVVAGTHLVSQLLRDFPYLARRHAAGQLVLPGVASKANPFEQRTVVEA